MTLPRPRAHRPPTVSAQGLGCMGMSFAYGAPDHDEPSPPSTGRSTWASRSSTRPTCTASATTRSRRPPSPAGATRSCWPPSSASVRRRPGRPGHRRRPGLRAAACDASLRRLGVDHIDLYYQHRVRPDRAHRGDRGRDGRAGGGGQGAASGAVRGAPDTIRRAAAVHPIAALQTEWSLFSRATSRTRSCPLP